MGCNRKVFTVRGERDPLITLFIGNTVQFLSGDCVEEIQYFWANASQCFAVGGKERRSVRVVGRQRERLRADEFAGGNVPTPDYAIRARG